MWKERNKRLARGLALLMAFFWYGSVVYSVFCVMPMVSLVVGWQVPRDTELDLPISVRYSEGAATQDLSPGALRILGNSRVQIHADSWWIAFVQALLQFICVIGLAVIVYQLRAFVRKVAAGHPFEENNPLRIRNIGVVLVILGPLAELWNTFIAHYYVTRLSVPSATLTAGVTLGWENVVIGLLLILVGQVFGVGVALQDEHDYTV